MITPECTLAYTQHVFKPGLSKKPKAGEKPKHSVVALFTAEALASPEWQAIVAEVIACAREAFGAKADTMIAEGAIKLPLRKDVVSKGYPEQFKGFLNLSSNEENPPAVVGRDAKPITDKREIYSGCKARVSVRAYAYGGPGTDYSPGVALGLGNIQKLGEGPRLDNKVSAEKEFGALEPLPAAPLAEGVPAGAASSASANAAALASLMS